MGVSGPTDVILHALIVQPFLPIMPTDYANAKVSSLDDEANVYVEFFRLILQK